MVVRCQLGDPARRDDLTIEADDLGSLLDRLELETALTELASRDREAIMLFHRADLALNDVAEILGVTPGTVKSRPHRARRQLATALRDEGTDR